MKTSVLLLLASPVLAEATTSTFTWNNPNTNYTVDSTNYEDEQTGMKVNEMRRTWEDYFFYAFSAKSVSSELTVAECSTSQECDNSGEMTQCCVSTSLYHPATDTQDIMYRCMTKTVANANINMQLDDFSVNMKCVKGGAQMLAVGASAAALALSLF